MHHVKVVCIAPVYNGCTMWRIVQPVNALLQHNKPVAWRMVTAPDAHEQMAIADVIVVQRLYFLDDAHKDLERWLHAARHYGGKRRTLIYELDDDCVSPECIPHMLVFHPTWTYDDADRHRRALMQTAQCFDAVTCTTPALAEQLQRYLHLPAYVLPNHIPWNAWRQVWRTRERTHPKPVIGWAGGLRIVDDLRVMFEAWRRISTRYPDTHFILAGWDEHTLSAHAGAIKGIKHLFLRPPVHVNYYPVAYADFDIMCCPLADKPFNYYKSPCKALEAGAAGAAVIASPIVYDTVIEHGKTGFLATTVDEWEYYLHLLIQQPALRNKIARRWSAKVEQLYNLERSCLQWYNTWCRIHQEVQSGSDQIRSGARLSQAV